jgi:hypothetical protein
MEIVKNTNKFENPEDVLKVLTAGGDFLSGGAINEEEQKEFLTYVRAYGVMLAPLYQDLSQFPDRSPIGRAAAARFVGGGAPTAGPGLVPGGAKMMAHSSGSISGHYDQMFIGGTITRGANTGGNDSFVQEGAVDSYSAVQGLNDVAGADDRQSNYSDVSEPAKFGRRTFNCVKLRSSYAASTEFFVQNIMNGRLNAELSAALAPRMVHDFEDLAINGDPNLAMNSKRNRLLRSNTGWLPISRAQSPTVDVDGEYLHWEHFVQAVKTVPDEFPMTDYKWWMNPHLWTDWVTALARYQSTGGGESFSAALQGNAMAPLGIPACLVPLLPRNDAISVRDGANAFEAGHSVLTGREPGPFFFPVGADTLIIETRNAADQVDQNFTVTFPDVADAVIEDRLLTADRVCVLINARAVAVGFPANTQIARVSQHGTIELVASIAGGAGGPSIDGTDIGVRNGTANANLGFVDEERAADSGAAPAAQGAIVRPEGTAMWLSPAENFIWHVTTAEPGSSSTGIRMFTKFEQDMDRIVTDVYSYQDATIAMPHMMVLCDRIRCARPGDLNSRAF